MTCMDLAHYSIGSPDSIFTHCEVGSHAQPAAIADTLGVFRDSIDAMTAIGRKAAAAGVAVTSMACYCSGNNGSFLCLTPCEVRRT